MTKCIICGTAFPDALVACPVKSGGEPKIFRKEICDACADKAGAYRPATPRTFPDAPTEGFLELAGAIERGTLETYRRLYHDAMIAAQRMDSVCTDEEITFLRLHKSVNDSTYHNTLTLGNIRELLDSARRSVQQDFPAYRNKDGLRYIEKRYEWYSRMQERAKSAAAAIEKIMF